MFPKVCWHPVLGTTWPLVLQCAPTQCCSLHLYSSSPSSSSFIATSSSSGLSAIPTGKFFYLFHVCVWPQVWTRKKKYRSTGKRNCIIYQKEINFRLVLLRCSLQKTIKSVRTLCELTHFPSFSVCTESICLFTCLYDGNNRAVGKINGDVGGHRDSIKKIQRMKNEWKMAKIALIVILLYVISWSPYSCVALTAFAGWESTSLTPTTHCFYYVLLDDVI